MNAATPAAAAPAAPNTLRRLNSQLGDGMVLPYEVGPPFALTCHHSARVKTVRMSDTHWDALGGIGARAWAGDMRCEDRLGRTADHAPDVSSHSRTGPTSNPERPS